MLTPPYIKVWNVLRDESLLDPGSGVNVDSSYRNEFDLLFQELCGIDDLTLDIGLKKNEQWIYFYNV